MGSQVGYSKELEYLYLRIGTDEGFGVGECHDVILL